MNSVLAALARGQDSLFLAEQAVQYGGYTERQVRRRIDDGEWVEMHPGVLRASTTRVTARSRATAALLAIGGVVALCGRTGAYFSGMRGFDEPDIIEAAVHIGREDVGLDGVDIRRRRGFTADQVVEYEGLAVVERHLLVLDLARTLSRARLHTLVQDEVHRRRVDVLALQAVRGRGREGSALLGRVLADYANKHDTEAEVVGCGLLREAGLHDLEPNRSPHPSLSPADALIRAAKTAVDINGSVHRNDRKRRADAAKVLDYAAYDHLLIPATDEDVFDGGIAWARRVADVVDMRRLQFRSAS